MNVTIRLRNDGYAPIYNERTAYLVLQDLTPQKLTLCYPLTADPRRWLPNGAVSYINEQIELPMFKEGTYHLYLWLPDKYESIANDSRYAVRLANKDVWDEKTGFNDLGADIVISNSAPKDPGELPDVQGLGKVQSDKGQCTKVLEDGVLYIVNTEGARYTLYGQITK